MIATRRALAAALVGLLAAACAQDDGALPARNFIAQGEAAHFEAAHRLTLGDVAGARAALQSAVDAAAPASAAPSDVRTLRKDLFYELAQLELAHGAPRDAARFATAGLDLGTEPDAFTANLQIARATALDRLGDATGAARDYHAALVTTEALLDQSLGTENSR